MSSVRSHGLREEAIVASAESLVRFGIVASDAA
jgi:hypothetical protein